MKLVSVRKHVGLLAFSLAIVWSYVQSTTWAVEQSGRCRQLWFRCNAGNYLEAMAMDKVNGLN